MIDKTYQPSEVEARIYAEWEAAGAFRAGRPERAGAEPYCIVIPPPNVTGSLHMGHALNNTLQDILCRFERMRGRDVLWQPGTDHAGIATQMVVERQLMERQEPGRREMGRDKFLERVWAWKAESGGTIVKQLKRLGASCDWSRERFTMDEGLSKAVIKVFVQLYSEGLIYKDKRLVNWDPKLLTAISDLEVQQVEIKGHLWHIRYPLEGKTFDPNDPSTFIVVATTRPETMLGDTAVAVHPDDERYKKLVGKHAILPLVGRRIPIVADDYSDPEKGSGAVKITPAHDFNDFEVWQRHKADALKDYRPISIFDSGGRLLLSPNFEFKSHIVDRYINQVEQTIHDLNGEDRFVARKRIVAALEGAGLLVKTEPHVHVVPHGDRSNAVIEPFLTDQWYVNAKALAVRAIDAVREGKTNFVPKNWEKTYFDWMEHIQPWCISRQLWWGHQIPAWYGPGVREDGGLVMTAATRPDLVAVEKLFVAESEPDVIRQAEQLYRRQVKVVSRQAFQKEMFDALFDDSKKTPIPICRDEDVLDTWFSSALWPFSTLGWPDKTPELARFYPTSTLVTGFDIIFFWVARMMMMGLHFMQKERPGAPSDQWVPFKDVYIHRLVRDEKGAKMSKSKGNVVDPLGIIDEYGADALRFTLARGAALGHDIKLAPQHVESNRNFATKLWNAARFAEMNGCKSDAAFNPYHVKESFNQWIVDRTWGAISDVKTSLEAYRFNDAANDSYRFVWSVFCDWYIELVKPVLQGNDGEAKNETHATLAWSLDQILKLLHPFMPFITEELWAQTAPGDGRPTLLTLADWPIAGPSFPDAEAEIGWVIDLVTAVRSVRAEMNITAQIPLVLAGVSAETRARAERWAEFVKRLARVAGISFADAPPQGSVQLLVRGEVAALPLKGVVDLDAERARLAKEMQKVEADIRRVDQKLANPSFIANAPEEVVEGEREKRDEAEGRRGKIVEALERLKGAA